MPMDSNHWSGPQGHNESTSLLYTTTIFSWRLKEELVKLLDDDPKYKSLKSLNFKFHVPPSSPNYTVWQGGKAKA